MANCFCLYLLNDLDQDLSGLEQEEKERDQAESRSEKMAKRLAALCNLDASSLLQAKPRLANGKKVRGRATGEGHLTFLAGIFNITLAIDTTMRELKRCRTLRFDCVNLVI